MTQFYVVELNAEALMTQFYVAGTETSSAVLRFALLYLCLNPDIQNRVHSEIDDIIGEAFTHWIPLHNISCAHLGTGLLFKFNGIVYNICTGSIKLYL